jgi:hypothetical protein
MNYSGSILWATTSYGCSATIYVKTEDGLMSGSYVFEGHKYELVIKEDKADYFVARIFYKSEEGGKAYLWKFTKGYEIVLKGQWEDKWSGKYDCCIHLVPES